MRKYSHSPYFAAKKAAAKRISELDGLSVGAFPSVERRVASLGLVYLPQTMEYLDYRKRIDRCCRPSRSRYSLDMACELGGFSAAIGISLAMDIGEAIVRDVKTLADPRARAILKRDLLRDLRIIRRPWYYAAETKRRRALAAERRKVRRSTTTAPCPTPEELFAAWKTRNDSIEAMIRLGSLLRDLSCYVDSTLRFDESGSVVGRNGGIRGWLKENLPELSAKYKTLMRYKAMDRKLRQATGTHDPTPTYAVYERAKTLDAASDGEVSVTRKSPYGAVGGISPSEKRRSEKETPSRGGKETSRRMETLADGKRMGRGISASRVNGAKGVMETNENSMRKILVAVLGSGKRVGNGGVMTERGRSGILSRGEWGRTGSSGRGDQIRNGRPLGNDRRRAASPLGNDRGRAASPLGNDRGRAASPLGNDRGRAASPSRCDQVGRTGGGRCAGTSERETFAALVRAVELSVSADRVGYC